MTVAEALVKVLGNDDGSTATITPELGKEVAFEIANDKVALVEILNLMQPEIIGKLRKYYSQEYKQN